MASPILHCSRKPCPPPACLGTKGGAAVEPSVSQPAAFQQATWTIKVKLALKVQWPGWGSGDGVRTGCARQRAALRVGVGTDFTKPQRNVAMKFLLVLACFLDVLRRMVLGFGKPASRTRPVAGWGPGAMSPASFHPLVPPRLWLLGWPATAGSAELVGSFSSCLICYVVLRTGLGAGNSSGSFHTWTSAALIRAMNPLRARWPGCVPVSSTGLDPAWVPWAVLGET